jgi:cysteine desulfurase
MEYYLDNASTTKINESVLKAYNHTATSYFGNPSANYTLAYNAKNKLEKTRSDIAEILEVNTPNIYFTSGGSESNAIILSSLLWNNSPGEIIMSKIEHASSLEFIKILKEKGWIIKTLNAPDGFIDPKDLENNMSERTRMVCIMLVNNVIGSIQNIEDLVKVVRNKENIYKRKIHFHTDAVQALTKIPFDLNKLDNQELVMDNLEIINDKSFVNIESTPVFTEIKDDDDLDNINLSDDDDTTDATIKTDDVGALTDYSKLTAKKLKEIAREKGLEAKGLKKKELVELLSGSQ